MGVAKGTSLMGLSFQLTWLLRRLRGIMASWHIHMSLGDCSSVRGLSLYRHSAIGALDGFA